MSKPHVTLLLPLTHEWFAVVTNYAYSLPSCIIIDRQNLCRF